MHGRLFEGATGRTTIFTFVTRFFFPLEGSPTWFKVLEDTGIEASPAKVKPRAGMSTGSAHGCLRSVSHVVLQLVSLGCIQVPSVEWNPEAQSRFLTVVNVTRSSCLFFFTSWLHLFVLNFNKFLEINQNFLFISQIKIMWANVKFQLSSHIIDFTTWMVYFAF